MIFNIGDRIIAKRICGLRHNIPVGSKGIIRNIENAHGDDNEIYVDFENITGSKFCGTLDDPWVRRIERIKKKLKPEDMIL